MRAGSIFARPPLSAVASATVCCGAIPNLQGIRLCPNRFSKLSLLIVFRRRCRENSRFVSSSSLNEHRRRRKVILQSLTLTFQIIAVFLRVLAALQLPEERFVRLIHTSVACAQHRLRPGVAPQVLALHAGAADLMHKMNISTSQTMWLGGKKRERVANGAATSSGVGDDAAVSRGEKTLLRSEAGNTPSLLTINNVSGGVCHHALLIWRHKLHLISQNSREAPTPSSCSPISHPHPPSLSTSVPLNPFCSQITKSAHHQRKEANKSNRCSTVIKSCPGNVMHVPTTTSTFHLLLLYVYGDSFWEKDITD